jgi:hypothetical protein
MTPAFRPIGIITAVVCKAPSWPGMTRPSLSSELRRSQQRNVMARSIRAIHDLLCTQKHVDGRTKSGHDDLFYRVHAAGPHEMARSGRAMTAFVVGAAVHLAKMVAMTSSERLWDGPIS